MRFSNFIISKNIYSMFSNYMCINVNVLLKEILVDFRLGLVLLEKVSQPENILKREFKFIEKMILIQMSFTFHIVLYFI